MITHWVKFNISSKNTLCKEFSLTLFIPHHAHQLNLAIEYVPTHDSVKSVISSAKLVVDFFNVVPKQKFNRQKILRRAEEMFEFLQTLRHLGTLISVCYRVSLKRDNVLKSLQTAYMIMKKYLQGLSVLSYRRNWEDTVLDKTIFNPRDNEADNYRDQLQS